MDPAACWCVEEVHRVGSRPIRDCSYAHSAEPVIVFGPGLSPWLADAVGGLSLMALAILILLALGGDVKRLRGSP